MSEKGEMPKGSCLSRPALYGFLLLAVLFIFGLIGGRSAFLIEFPFRFVCGWVFHGWKELPPFLGKWRSAVLPVGCLLLAGVLAHRFVCRWVAEKRPSQVWQAKHTTAVMALVLLFSAAAIATSGIFHQFFWLSSGKVIENNRRSEVVVAINNGRQLMLALMEFQLDHGHYPDHLSQLDEQAYDPQRLAWVTIGNGSAPEPFILLKPGSSEIALDEEPLLVSPLMENGRKAVVGYGDMSVRMVTVQNLEAILGKAKADNDE